MSTEEPTITRTSRNSQDSRAKRQRNGVTATPPSSQEDTARTVPEKKLSPSETALASAEPYFQSLHPGIRASLVPSLKEVFKLQATFYFKNRKHQEMLLDTTYVPSSCRKTLPLNVLQEVTESEGFITLSANLNAVLVRHEQELARFARSAHDLNRLATSKRAQKAFSLALHEGARGFIAQIGDSLLKLESWDTQPIKRLWTHWRSIPMT